MLNTISVLDYSLNCKCINIYANTNIFIQILDSCILLKIHYISINVSKYATIFHYYKALMGLHACLTG